MTDASSRSSKPGRRWFQFSLRSLLIVVTLVSGLLVVWRFKHLGIENDQSVLEWNKRWPIIGWRLDIDPRARAKFSVSRLACHSSPLRN